MVVTTYGDEEAARNPYRIDTGRPLRRRSVVGDEDRYAAGSIRTRFGRAIRRVREEQKINQEEAAERCGLHRTYYSGVERGVRNVSLVNIERIARGLKKYLPELFRHVK
jgi:DNA-binding XRE family transcriptional regulator